MPNFVQVTSNPNARPGVNELGNLFVRACNIGLTFDYDSRHAPMDVLAHVQDRLSELDDACQRVNLHLLSMDSPNPMADLANLFATVLNSFNAEVTNNPSMSLMNPEFMTGVDNMMANIAQTYVVIIRYWMDSNNYSILNQGGG